MTPAAVFPSTMLSFTVSVNRNTSSPSLVKRPLVSPSSAPPLPSVKEILPTDPVTPLMVMTLPLLTVWLISVFGAPSAASRVENALGRAVLVSSFCRPAVSSRVTVVPVTVTVSAMRNLLQKHQSMVSLHSTNSMRRLFGEPPRLPRGAVFLRTIGQREMGVARLGSISRSPFLPCLKDRCGREVAARNQSNIAACYAPLICRERKGRANETLTLKSRHQRVAPRAPPA